MGSKIVRKLINSGNDVSSSYYKNKLNVKNEYELDIRKKDETVELISKLYPDIVIHTASLTNIDLCEMNKKLADSVNIEGTKNVISGCQKTDSKLIYISTSFVFNGEKKEYLEEDKLTPATYYGFTKFKGEEIVKNSKLSFLILRTDQPYDWKEKWQSTNSVLRVLETLQEGKILNEIVDWYNVPTYLPDFVNALENLINSNLLGIFHVCGSIFGLNENMIKPINSKILNLAAKRVNVNLSNEKLFQKIGIKMMGIEKGLQSMKENKEL